MNRKEQRLLAIWAEKCAKHVLKYSKDKRPGIALKVLKKWIKDGIFSMKIIRKAALDSHAAARKYSEDSPARFAARAAGQAVATAHVPEHAFGASYYALKIYENDNAKLFKEYSWQQKNLPKKPEKEMEIMDDKAPA